MAHESWRTIERMLNEQGWRIVYKGTHGGRGAQCYPPDKSKPMVHCVADEGGDPRAMRNNIRDLRASGFIYRESDRDEASSDDTQRVLRPDSLRWLQDQEGSDALRDLLGDQLIDGVGDMCGMHFARLDRVDPRDPKTIVSFDFDNKRVILLDRHQRRLVQSFRDFERDVRKRKLRVVPPEEADQLPSVKGMQFPKALRTLRIASNATQESVAGLLGDRGLSGQAVSFWEAGSHAPVRKHYQQLCTLWPGLHEADPPDFKLPDRDVATGPRESPAEPPIVSVSGGMRALRHALRQLDDEQLDSLVERLGTDFAELSNALVDAKRALDAAVPADPTTGVSGEVVDDHASAEEETVPVSTPGSSAPNVDLFEVTHDVVHKLLQYKPSFSLQRVESKLPSHASRGVWVVRARHPDVEQTLLGEGPHVTDALRDILNQLRGVFDEREAAIREQERKLREQREHFARLVGE